VEREGPGLRRFGGIRVGNHNIDCGVITAGVTVAGDTTQAAESRAGGRKVGAFNQSRRAVSEVCA